MYSNSFNDCMLIGKCGNNLTLRYTKKGVPVTNLVLGTQEVWKNNRTSEINKSMKWHKVVIWGKLAEKAVKFVRKGMTLLVKGPIIYRDYFTNEGQKVSVTEIKAIKIQKIVGSYHNKDFHQNDNDTEDNNYNYNDIEDKDHPNDAA